MPRLLDCPFTVELGATEMRVAMSALAALAPGRLLSFARSAEEPASLLIAGREKFHALPVCCGHTRAARVLESVRKAAGGLAETKEKSK